MSPGATTPEVGAVVVGAGAAGLAAALSLQRRGVEVLVVDAGDRPGGVLRTDHVAGYVVERGPNTFQVKAPMLAFLRAVGLEDALRKAEPASRLRFLVRDGALVPVPASPAAFVTTPLLSAGAKARLLLDLVPGRGPSGPETVAEFARRRFGAGVASQLVGPFLTGVYAGDEEALGAESVFPSLVAAERRAGSVGLGLLAQALGGRRSRSLRGTWSTVEGLGPFARRLAERLAEPPALETRLTSLARDGAGWCLDFEGPGGGRSLRTRRVVLATPAYAAAPLLRSVEPDAAAVLDAVHYAPIVAAPLGVRPLHVREGIEGFGFLVPRSESLRILGCLFMSRLFPGRAPEGSELLHVMVGGTRWPEALELADEALEEQITRDLDRVLGLREPPRWLGPARWPRAIPQPDRDHARRIAAAREKVAVLPGLALAGSYLEGVSVADTVASGVRAAEELL